MTLRSQGPGRRLVAVLLCLLAAAAPAQALANDATSIAALAQAAKPVPLSLKFMVERLLSSNRTVLSKQYEGEIAATGIDRAQAAFQPAATVSAQNGRSLTLNTVEEKLVRSNTDVYDKYGQDYSLGLSQLLASGAKVEGKVTLSRFATNLVKDQMSPEGRYNRSYYGVGVTQPLARDAGTQVTMARLRQAELDTAAAQHANRDTESSVAADAVLSYFDWSLAQQRVALAMEKIAMGERLLALARNLSRLGRLPQSDVWEVENALIRYQASVSEARQAELERVNKIRTLLMATVDDLPDLLKATEALPTVKLEPLELQDSLALALQRREDLRLRKTLLQREGIQVAYATNQALPRIDLVASYGLNGLSMSAYTAFSRPATAPFSSFSVGLQMSLPLGENKQARADLAAALVRQKDALLAIKALEVSIANDVETSAGLLQSSVQRWTLGRETLQREQQQLELEHKRLASGRSDFREILTREERVINARLGLIEQQVAYARAEALLQAAQGTLMERFR